MEPRFDHDFSHVRVHTDSKAGNSAQQINALAYTVGSNVVFASARFEPNTQAGQQLLAHELTHVLQQNGHGIEIGPQVSSIDPDPAMEAEAISAEDATRREPAPTARLFPRVALQRKPAGGKPSPAFIKDLVVDQNQPQTVQATFSDGRVETDECSTGKGHCCFDEMAGTAEGGACSAARSNQIGNNCTPVGTFTVTAKIPVTEGGIKFWTQFHDAKSVALHDYDPRVDGTPLSHGCVRLHGPMAETIFNGARTGVTRVRVQGLAVPLCNDSALQKEWAGDFTDAGSKPPDGQIIDPFLGRRPTKQEIAREQHHIAGTRREMRSALGVDEAGLDVELATVKGGASVLSKIPRCAPALTKEEQKVPEAKKEGFLAPGAAATAAAFTKALNQSRAAAGAESTVRKFGGQLWLDATTAARGGGAGSDDRQLYWTRLMMTTALRAWNPSWSPDADALRRLQTRLLHILEQTSRGMTASAFPADPNLKRILISGFDPFGFQNAGDIRQSNLSGAAAIALDGTTITDGKVSARIEAVVFPTRYADFNDEIAENFLRPHLAGAQPPHLVMSISQGVSKFEFEESAGRRRSGRDSRYASYLDNLGRSGGGTPTRPVEPPGLAPGAEFLHTNVSPGLLGAMRGAEGRTSAITEETEVYDLPAGASAPRHLPSGPGSSPGQAVEGAGGGFLSNEIFYRNSLLRTGTGSTVPMIHLHTPKLAPGAADTVRNDMIERIRKILRAALPHL
jgi:hypothetical protein